MIAPIVAAGIAYILLRTPKAKYPHSMYDCATGKEYTANTEAEHQAFADLGYVHKMSECPMPEDPSPTTPDPSETKWTDTASWSGEEFSTGPGGENVVWVYRRGIRFQDGSTEMDDNEYIVIGDKVHHNFLRSSSDRGTIDIPKRFTGGTTDQQNVQVFSSLETALAKADSLSNPEPTDPNDPTQPQKPDEPEDEPTSPGLPTRPGNDLGGMGGYTNLSGGGF